MFRWKRDRLARFNAGVLMTVLLLALSLLTLVPRPALAQTTTPINLPDILDDQNQTSPTRIAVLDFYNASKYRTGMLGRVLGDAVCIEMINAKTFEVVKRSELDDVFDDMHLSVPLSYEAQALVAERVKSQFTLAGTIKSVEIHKSRNGTYASVMLEALVVSRVTKSPINGARIVQESSRKIGYSGDTDTMVQEALRTAAYQIASKLKDNRLPIATILTSPRSGEVLLKGGSAIGLRSGMRLMALRRSTQTGTLQVVSVSPNDAIAKVLNASNSSVAPGDKCIPEFHLDSPTGPKAGVKSNMLQMVAALAGGAAMAMFIKSDGGDNSYLAPNCTARPLADAVAMNQPDGANLVRWESKGKQVIAYILYRDTNTRIPIAVLDGHTTQYIDSAKPLPAGIAEKTNVKITVDSATGALTGMTYTTTYPTDPATLDDVTSTRTDTSYDTTTIRIPLHPGEACGYILQVLFINYNRGALDDEAGHPMSYRLYMGTQGRPSNRITLTGVPVLDTPADSMLPVDGNFRCLRVPSATQYILQLSADDPTFGDPDRRRDIQAIIESDLYALGQIALDDIFADPNLGDANVIYWRMGAVVAGQPLPLAMQDMNSNGWVFSAPFTFVMPSSPPPLPLTRSWRSLGGHGLPGKIGPSGRGHSRGMLRHR